MKNIITFLSVVILILSTGTVFSQILDKFRKKVENKSMQRVERKVDKAIDKGLDMTEGSIQNGKKGSSGADTLGPDDGVKPESSGEFSYSTTFDFVPGEKTLWSDNFSQGSLGDFPVGWWTNGGGQLVRVKDYTSMWLEIKGNFTYYPEGIALLPENFTLEFDLIFNFANERTSRNILGIYLLESSKDQLEEAVYKFGRCISGIRGAAIEFYAYNNYWYEVSNWSGKKEGPINAKTEEPMIKSFQGTPRHISISRQGPRVRMYVDQEKVIDTPRLLDSEAEYNQLKFAYEEMNHGGRAYLANIRLAEGVPDMRAQLLSDGKVSTTAITFATNSDHVKPSSMGAIREISLALQSNPDLRLNIIGHTDSDGDDQFNMALSRRRAEAVKAILTGQFAIDSSRLSSAGMGESKPLNSNLSPEEKTANRRVEFVRI